MSGEAEGAPHGESVTGAAGPDVPSPEENGTVELTEEELAGWGRRIGEVATRTGEDAGVVVALHGPLGAGKTTLVRAACRGAGVEGRVRSPTFTLHNHHRPPGRRPIHHVDLYRLDGPEDLDDLGWDDLTAARGAVFVEWAERAGGRLPADRWEIRLAIADDPDRRRVSARALGEVPALPAPGAAGRQGAGEQPPSDSADGPRPGAEDGPRRAAGDVPPDGPEGDPSGGGPSGPGRASC